MNLFSLLKGVLVEHIGVFVCAFLVLLVASLGQGGMVQPNIVGGVENNVFSLLLFDVVKMLTLIVAIITIMRRGHSKESKPTILNIIMAAFKSMMTFALLFLSGILLIAFFYDGDSVHNIKNVVLSPNQKTVILTYLFFVAVVSISATLHAMSRHILNGQIRRISKRQPFTAKNVVGYTYLAPVMGFKSGVRDAPTLLMVVVIIALMVLTSYANVNGLMLVSGLSSAIVGVCQLLALSFVHRCSEIKYLENLTLKSNDKSSENPNFDD